MKIRIDEAARFAIKSATRQAVHALGGLKIAAAETGLSDTQLSRCCLAHEPDLISVDAAVLLDRALGEPLILSAARDCVRQPHASGLALDDAGALAKYSGDAMARVLAALNDGRISPGEARDVSAALADLLRSVRAAKRKADALAAQ